MPQMLNENNVIFEQINNTRFLLREFLDKNDIIEAIQNQSVIYIYYNGIDGVITKGYRTIEPYCFGVSTAGNVVVRAWQQAGASDSNKGLKRPKRPGHDDIPGWRLFYFDGITSIMPTGKIFSSEQGKIRPNYNPNDKQMKEIFIAVEPMKRDDLVLKNQDNIGKSSSTEKEVSSFQNQADKFKGDIGYRTNKEAVEKKNIIDLYELVTKHKKKSPSKYYVINKDGKYYAVSEVGLNKFKDAENLGNLKDLFYKFSNVTKPSTAFFNQQRELFKKSLIKK